VVARVKEITDGKGAYAALDPIGGNMTANVRAGIRFHAFLITVRPSVCLSAHVAVCLSVRLSICLLVLQYSNVLKLALVTRSRGLGSCAVLFSINDSYC
jgi:hypothetical protein